jgi:electron transport complex protein RnfB
MLATMLILILLAAALGAALFRMRPPLTTLVAHSSAPEDDPLPLVERINRLLPQTQCQQCQYDGCKPYAEAIVAGNADINVHLVASAASPNWHSCSAARRYR